MRGAVLLFVLQLVIQLGLFIPVSSSCNDPPSQCKVIGGDVVNQYINGTDIKWSATAACLPISTGTFEAYIEESLDATYMWMSGNQFCSVSPTNPRNPYTCRSLGTSKFCRARINGPACSTWFEDFVTPGDCVLQSVTINCQDSVVSFACTRGSRAFVLVNRAVPDAAGQLTYPSAAYLSYPDAASPLVLPDLRDGDRVVVLGQNGNGVTKNVTGMCAPFLITDLLATTPTPTPAGCVNVAQAPWGTASASPWTNVWQRSLMPSVANDGNQYGAWLRNQVFQSTNQLNPWWTVTLNSTARVYEIVIFPRVDLVAPVYPLVGFTVTLLNGMLSTWTTTVSTTVTSRYVLRLPAPGVFGSAVRIQKTGAGVLEFAEVEVWACLASCPVPASTVPSVTSFDTLLQPWGTMNLTVARVNTCPSGTRPLYDLSLVALANPDTVFSTVTVANPPGTANVSFQWTGFDTYAYSTAAVVRCVSPCLQVAASASYQCLNVAQAPWGVATASSVSSGPSGTLWLDSSVAIDGNTGGNLLLNEVAETRNSSQPWWMVSLAQAYSVQRVVVHPRTDCCQDRLMNFDVTAFRNGLAVWTVTSLWQPVQTPLPLVPPAGAAPADAIRVQLQGVNTLDIAEFQVISCIDGCPPVITPAPTPSVQIAQYSDACGAANLTVARVSTCPAGTRPLYTIDLFQTETPDDWLYSTVTIGDPSVAGQQPRWFWRGLPPSAKFRPVVTVGCMNRCHVVVSSAAVTLPAGVLFTPSC